MLKVKLERSEESHKRRGERLIEFSEDRKANFPIIRNKLSKDLNRS